MDLHAYEHAYLRPLHPEASDERIAELVAQLRADSERYAKRAADRPSCPVFTPAK